MDLELATLDDIAAELRKRYAGMLLAVTGPEPGIEPRVEGTAMYWGGSPITAIGLAEHAKYRLLDRDSIEVPDDDAE